MRKRLGEFALSLHPEKTRLIEFGRFAAERRQRRRLGRPETFNFLGFTFICGKTLSGKFQIKRKTRRKRGLAIDRDLRCRQTKPIASLPRRANQGQRHEAVVLMGRDMRGQEDALAPRALDEPFDRPEFDLPGWWRAHVADFRARLHRDEATIRLSPRGKRSATDNIVVGAILWIRHYRQKIRTPAIVSSAAAAR